MDHNGQMLARCSVRPPLERYMFLGRLTTEEATGMVEQCLRPETDVRIVLYCCSIDRIVLRSRWHVLVSLCSPFLANHGQPSFLCLLLQHVPHSEPVCQTGQHVGLCLFCFVGVLSASIPLTRFKSMSRQKKHWPNLF